jgi:hypothetical protein
MVMVAGRASRPSVLLIKASKIGICRQAIQSTNGN